MPLDHYITLGRSGLRVSPLCLGTMTFGLDWGWGSTVEESEAIMSAYMDKGGNFLDTANMYTKGHSEAIIGEHLAKAKGKRDRAVIATKCTGNMIAGDPNGGGSGRKALIAAVDESLRRLKTDYIDLLWAHFFDKHTPIEETLHTFDVLIEQGKVRYVGLSDHPAWICAKAYYICHQYGWHRISAIQIEYSLIERSVEAELIPMAMDLGMGVTPWSPLKGGLLTGKFTRDSKPDNARNTQREISDREYEVIDALVAVAGEAGASPAQVALKWVQDQEGVASTIIGARTIEQLNDNLGALNVNLSEEQQTRLDEVSKVDRPFPHDFLDRVRTVIQHGATVNGHKTDRWDLGADDSTRH